MKWMNLGEKVQMTASMMASVLINAYRNPAAMSFSRILCIRQDEIGDMCYTTHVFEHLRRRYPKANITLLCKPYAAELLSNDPHLDVIVSRFNDLSGAYDLVLDLRCSWRSIFYALTHWPAARLDRGTVRFSDSMKGSYLHEVETNFRIIKPLLGSERMAAPKLYPSDASWRKAEQFIYENQLSDFAVLHPGARRELRKWPVQHFIQLAHHLNQKNLQIVFTGDASEKEAIDAIRSKIPFRTSSTAGMLSLSELAALLGRASLYVGNESGPLHMASIMNVPSIGLYGPGPAHIFYPYGVRTAVIHHILECNPCDQIHCRYAENPCIQRITVREVADKVEELLKAYPLSPSTAGFTG